MPKKLKNEDVIENILKIRGNQYDYSEYVYSGSKSKGIIICHKLDELGKEHGKFLQSYECHANRKHNCPKCFKENHGKNQIKSLEHYISTSKEINKDKNYDYSLITEINSCKEKVPIICNEFDIDGNKHDIFYQTMDAHINNKTGCPKCAIENSGSSQRLTKDIFVNKANLLYPKDDYNYDDFIYVNYLTPGKIYCNIHKEYFLKSPSNHLKTIDPQGCPKCGYERCSLIQRSSKDEFVEKANIKHTINNINKYTYDKFIYINSSTKGIITCSEHGDFAQAPSTHLAGHGCSKCNDSSGEITVEKILSDLKFTYINQYKFDDCRDKRSLKFDFGIFKHGKLIALIEYDGSFHYSETQLKKWGCKKHRNYTKENYHETKKRDRIKNKYCLKNNIPMLRICFWNEFTRNKTSKEDIEQQIKDFINSLSKV